MFAFVGIGGYVWWQMQPKGALIAGVPPLPAHQISPSSLPPPQVAPVLPPSVATSVPPESTIHVPPQPLAPPMASSGRSGTDDDEPTRPSPLAQKIAPATEAAAFSPSPIKVTKAQIRFDATLEQAYQAFRRNDPEQAQTLWQKVLARDPLNADALHGLATLALRQQKGDEAANYFRRILDINPKDAVALSALSTLRSPADPTQAESQLKLQLAEQPDSPHLNFALGNLYARLTRWPEAQQAYFRAHGADPTNPDYLFNLAVSLDQLRQPRLAVQFYSRAITAAERQPASFDHTQVAARLNILQSSLLH